MATIPAQSTVPAGTSRFAADTEITGLLSGVRALLGAFAANLLSIANGGTNSGTALNNGCAIVSSGGGIVELAAGTSGQLLQQGASAPVWAGDTAWTGPALLNSWVQHGTLQTVGYMKTADGIVHLRGGIKNGTVNAAAFTLPAGSRPSGQQQYAVPSNDLFGLVQVKTTGDVVPAVGSNVYFSLDGITFDTR